MRRRTLPAAVAGAAAGVLLAGGIAFATVPSADGKVWVCFGNNETLRVLDKEAGETCRGTELALLGAAAKAADADQLDGLDSTSFLRDLPDTIRSVHVAPDTLTGDDIGAGAIGTGELGAAAVTADKIADEPAVKQSITVLDHAIDSASVQTVTQVTVTAPASGFIQLSARATMFNRDGVGYVNVWLREGADTLAATFWEPGDLDSYFDSTQSIEQVVPVTPGSHTYSLAMRTPGGLVQIGRADIVGAYYPTALP